MELANTRILFVMVLAAEYGGNLIPSWQYYSRKLKNEYHARIAWVFPHQPAKKWLTDLQKEDDVFFIPPPQSVDVIKELGKVILQFRPDIIHSHFELYDIAVSKAVKRYAPQTRMVWHVHDIMSFDVKGVSHPVLRYIRRRILYSLRYHVYGRDAWFVAVSDEMAHFVNYFRRHFFTTPPPFDRTKIDRTCWVRTTSLMNGLSLPRLGDIPHEKPKTASVPFRFLTFGGNFHGKGIDTVLDAGRRLEQKNRKFQIIITRGNDLEMSIMDHMNGHIPPWLKIVEQTEHVRDLFLNADCYISASRGETMSVAVAEAEMFLLPVIQSDINGTFWNAEMPSTLLFPVEDAASLSEQMEKMMDDQCRISAMTLQTRQKVLDRFDLDLWCEKLLQIYEGL